VHLRHTAIALQYTALDNGDQMHTKLVDALDASYRADIALQGWAQSLSGHCTRSAAKSSSQLSDAMDASAEAKGYKTAFRCSRSAWAARLTSGKLGQLSAKRTPVMLKGLSFREFFGWLSASLSTASSSLAFGTSDSQVAAAETAQQIPLPEPTGWATV